MEGTFLSVNDSQHSQGKTPTQKASQIDYFAATEEWLCMCLFQELMQQIANT